MHIESPFVTLLHGLSAPAAPGSPVPARRLRILVVDDDLSTRHLHSLWLARAGYTVDAAGDGEEAWAAMLAVRFDLLITDHNMPRLCGLELVARMRAAGIRLPAILSSGCIDMGLASDYPRLDLAAVLRKPFGCGELLQAVKHILPVPPDAGAGSVRNAAQTAANVVPLPIVKVLPPPEQQASLKN